MQQQNNFFGAGSSNANGNGGANNAQLNATLDPPNLYQPSVRVETDDFYANLSATGGFGYGVIRLVTSRPGNGHWENWDDMDSRTWVEDGTNVAYRSVQGPLSRVDGNGQPFMPGHIRIDERGRRYRRIDDGSWNLEGGFTQVQEARDGTVTTVNSAGEPADPDQWRPLQLFPNHDIDPTLLWQGLQAIYPSAPRAEPVEGGVRNPPLVPSEEAESSVASGSSGTPAPDLRLRDPAWQRVDNWLTQAFPLNEYPAAASLDLRLKHLEAYFPRVPPPFFKHSQTIPEKQGLWISVQIEILVPCIWASAHPYVNPVNGKAPFRIPREGSPAPCPYDEVAIQRVEAAIRSEMEYFFANQSRAGEQTPHLSWDTRLYMNRPANKSIGLTDDSSKWYWHVESKGTWMADKEIYPLSSYINVQRFLITSPAYQIQDHIWPMEVAGMFNQLQVGMPWYQGTSSQPAVEVGPIKDWYFSTQQLRDIASLWYACEPYLSSLLSHRQLWTAKTKPVHGRCRAAWNELAERTNWLCRLQQHGSMFPSFPMLVSRRMPELPQTPDDLAENGPEEAGQYNVAQGRRVARGTTVIHNGVTPANDFFPRRPLDYNGNPTGTRENLWRLNRNDVINNIQRAASSPSVAMMMTCSAQPFSSNGDREYLDLSNYAARNLGEPSAQNPRRSITVRMGPSTLFGDDIGAWMCIVAAVIIPAASENWDALVGTYMPPPHELVPSKGDEREQTNNGVVSYPQQIQTRYSRKFDVFDLLHKLTLPRPIINYIEQQMIEGFDGDG